MKLSPRKRSFFIPRRDLKTIDFSKNFLSQRLILCMQSFSVFIRLIFVKNKMRFVEGRNKNCYIYLKELLQSVFPHWQGDIAMFFLRCDTMRSFVVIRCELESSSILFDVYRPKSYLDIILRYWPMPRTLRRVDATTSAQIFPNSHQDNLVITQTPVDQDKCDVDSLNSLLSLCGMMFLNQR